MKPLVPIFLFLISIEILFLFNSSLVNHSWHCSSAPKLLSVSEFSCLLPSFSYLREFSFLVARQCWGLKNHSWQYNSWKHNIQLLYEWRVPAFKLPIKIGLPGEGLQDCCVGKQELAKTYLALLLLIFNTFVKSGIADNVEQVRQFFLASFQFKC